MTKKTGLHKSAILIIEDFHFSIQLQQFCTFYQISYILFSVQFYHGCNFPFGSTKNKRLKKTAK